MSKKQEQAQILDPARFQIAKSMATIPGGPPNLQMNNPNNVISQFGSNEGQIASQPGLRDGVGLNPYMDALVASQGLGTNVVMPQQPSGLPQQMAVGNRLNAHPYGTGTQDMDQITAAMAEGSRLSFGGFSKPVAASAPMGYIGVANPAVTKGMPADTPEQMPNSSLPLQGFADVERVVGQGMSTRNGRRA